MTPLHFASEYNSPDVAELLIRSGAHLDANGYVSATQIKHHAITTLVIKYAPCFLAMHYWYDCLINTIAGNDGMALGGRDGCL